MLDGDDFEARSAALLERHGLRIIARQYRCRVGEIDLVATDEHCLLFVEVRARRKRSHGGAAASVDRRKQCKLARCAAFFLSQHPQWGHLPCRFDVVAWESADASASGGRGGQRPRNPGPDAEPSASEASGDTADMQAHWLKAAFTL